MFSMAEQRRRQEIAARIQEEMARRGWTGARLARQARLSEKTVSRLLNARLDPRYDTLEAIAQALERSEAFLIHGDEHPPEPTQLDRIEALLERIYQALSGETAPADDTAKGVAESGDRLRRRARRPRKPTGGQP